MAARIARRNPPVFAKASLTFSLRPVIARPELAREGFFSPDLPATDLMAYWRLMQNESYRALLDMVMLYLGMVYFREYPLLTSGAAA